MPRRGLSLPVALPQTSSPPLLRLTQLASRTTHACPPGAPESSIRNAWNSAKRRRRHPPDCRRAPADNRHRILESRTPSRNRPPVAPASNPPPQRNLSYKRSIHCKIAVQRCLFPKSPRLSFSDQSFRQHSKRFKELNPIRDCVPLRLALGKGPQ